MADPKTFAANIRRTARSLEQGVEIAVRKTALAAHQAVVVGTPVDEGTARSNWQAELDRPASGTRPAYSPGSKGSTGAQNAQAAIDEGRSVIGGFRINKNREIHLTNNLPYIGQLNSGSSAQAPEGFVEEALAAAVKAFGGAAKAVLRRR